MNNAKAFSNVRILDFTHYLAGPFGTFQLALQGADVIKIEPQGGDGMRLSPVSKTWSDRGLSPGWMAVNANKRSMVLDLSKPEAVEIIHKLAAEADVVCENFRPGVLERLGMGYQQLSALNPRLIYCAISGFGSTGPERGTASFDGKIQAMSGLMSLTGDPEGGPMRAGFAAADVTAGMMAAFAVATALYQRTHTGEGQFVDVSMLDSMLNFLSLPVAEYTVDGFRHTQFGNRSVSRKPTADRFRCGDGFIVLAVLTDKQFNKMLEALGRADLLDDARFADWFTRTENAQVLREIIESAMDGGDPKVWEQRLTAADVPCATVYTLPEILAHPQVVHRGLLRETATPHGPVQLVGPAFTLAHGSGGIDRPAVLPGANTDEILSELGYPEAEVTRLHQVGVV
ncbi:CoA transferase [Hydrogenophaga sp. D2P1]|uniref:CoA transferase n=1 Tax=Hydrogenophaga aromaticivorans TaxID=2610898 RepID=A0A7Y8GTW6_9BURK|nr:CoA transferase [Hydrogenophaga aromaticivorans]NWF44737.1 CoA transferase [Hydrogenophaga aromaticivorans]